MFTSTLLSGALLLATSSMHAYAQGVATFSSEGTWYDPAQDQGIGACGWMNVSSQFVVAIAFTEFDNYPGAGSNPNMDPICGQVIQINYEGKSVVAQIVDKCLTCLLPYDVDMSNVTFSSLADTTEGRLKNPGITWSFVPKTTQLGETTSPAPAPPPDTPLPPARRSFDGHEQWKRTPEPNGFAPLQESRMIKRRSTTGKSDAPGENDSVSIETRNADHLTKPNGDPEAHPVRRDVPSRRVTRRAVEKQTRKPPSRGSTPPQTLSVKRRMIKVARRSG